MSDYWDVTINVLQPLIAKPTLKPALLQKPPFRFLLDIVVALSGSTGFPAGLYPPEQLETEYVKAMEKDAKLAFLNRLILCASLAVSRDIDVSSSKIIAGAEPEKTNALLQALAEAAGKLAQGQIQMGEIIAAVERGDKPGAATKPAAAPAAKPQPAAAPVATPAPVAAAAAPATSPSAAASKPRPAVAAASSSSSASSALRPTRASIPLPPAEASEDFVATTTRLVGTLIQKPKMTDKLLRKPPFRFLHDILTAVLAATSFPEGYFTPEELDSASFNETSAKLSFLQKWIDLVSYTNNVDLTQVNPKKIAAGLEPEQTNMLLQQFAYAAASGIDAKDVVKKMEAVSGGAGNDAAAAQAAAAQAAQQQQQQAAAAQQAEADRRAKAAADAESRKTAALAASAAAQATAAAAAAASPPSKPMPRLGLDAAAVTAAATEESKEEDPAAGGVGAQPRGKIERPKTARKAPPKLASNLIDESKKTTSSSPNAPAEEKQQQEVPTAVVLIAEGENAQDDVESDDEGGANGAAADNEPLQGFDSTNNTNGATGDANGEDGMIVRAMKDKLKGVAADNKESGGMKIRSSASATAGGGMSQTQIDELRKSIQTLCQSVNPLGKCLDYVREDMDSMNKELIRWRGQYTTYNEELEEEKKVTERIVEPLQTQLTEIDAQIAEQQRKIHLIKGTIMRNDKSIQQLMEQKIATAQS